jgi:hypothetical protein
MRQLQRAGNDVPYLLVGMLVRVDVRMRRDVVVGIRQVVGVKEPATPTGPRLVRRQAARVDERHACD